MKKIILIGTSLYVLAFAILVFGQNSIIYPLNSNHVTPKAAGEPRLTERKLVTEDDQTLILWVAKAKRNRPTLLYFHGNAGNLKARAQRFDRLLDRGYGIVALAYRGSSGSTGISNEATITQDAKLVHRSLPDLLGAAPRTLIYYGESLGSAVAIKLATQNNPSGIILEAPFASMTRLAQEKLRVFPVRLGLQSHWLSLKNAPRIKAPLLVMHGTADDVVPFEHGLAVYNAADSSQKTMLKRKGLGHVGHWDVTGQRAIFKFLEKF